MTQRDQIAADICGQDSNKGEAQSTFDRLLREYFATLRDTESVAISEESRSFEVLATHERAVLTPPVPFLDRKSVRSPDDPTVTRTNNRNFAALK
jgi:hypothetical protein